MTSTPSRRTVVRSIAWTTPVVAAVAAAPAFATSLPPLFRVNVSRPRNGSAVLTVTNQSDSPITVTMTVPIVQDESFGTSGTYSGWTTTFPGDRTVATTTIGPSSTSGTVSLGWDRDRGTGRFTVTTTSGDLTITTTMPWAA